jgi:outer membrane lipoprotein LolB
MNKAFSGLSHGYSRFFIASTSLALSLLMTACGSLRPPATSEMSAAAVATRSYQQQLQLSGRIQVQYQQNDKPQSLPGSFEWLQDKDSTDITLISPLGQTIATISQNAAGANLQQANQPLRSAANLDSLLNETLGWPLPVSGLRDWLQGYILTPDGKHQMLAAQENLNLEADGWRIRYVSWQEQDGQVHPKRIDLQRYTSEAGEVSMRIIIDQWKTP